MKDGRKRGDKEKISLMEERKRKMGGLLDREWVVRVDEATPLRRKRCGSLTNPHPLVVKLYWDGGETILVVVDVIFYVVAEFEETSEVVESEHGTVSAEVNKIELPIRGFNRGAFAPL